MSTKMKLKRTDLFLLIFLIILGAILCVIIYLPRTVSGNYVELRVDGKVIGTWSLSADLTKSIQAGGGTNTFYIEKETVYMKEADCHDKTCVNMRGISRVGESIVCLPHRLVLEIVNRENETPQIDAVTGGGS